MGLGLTFHESRSPGGLIERIDGDVNELAEFFSGLIVQLIGNEEGATSALLDDPESRLAEFYRLGGVLR